MSCKHVFITKVHVFESRFGFGHFLGRIVMYCPLCKTEFSSREVDIDLARICEPTDTVCLKDERDYYITE